MADTNNKLIILVLLNCLLPHIVFSSASAKDNDTKAYVDSWCQTTLYQELCVRSLSPYVSLRATQSPEDLVRFLLNESHNQVLETLKILEKLLTRSGDVTAVKVQELVTLLRGIVRKLPMLTDLHSGRDGVGAKYINLQRLTSTALADLETLVSKFQGRRLSKLEATIYGKVKNVEETTKNALAIVQHYAAARH